MTPEDTKILEDIYRKLERCAPTSEKERTQALKLLIGIILSNMERGPTIPDVKPFDYSPK